MAQLSSLPERVAALRAAVGDQAEPLVTLTHLLRLCRDEHAVLWERVGDPACRARVATALTGITAEVAGRPATSAVEPAVRRLLAAALQPVGDMPAVVLAHALAGFIDERYGDSFAGSFRRRSPYQPAVGDPIPLDSPDLRKITALRPTSPPWRLANRLDETRRVRLAGEWAVQFRVVFAYSLAAVLDGLITADTVIATCHPNSDLTEFDLTRQSDGRTFPVRPADPGRQRTQINELIARAAAAGATIVVLPELCVTESLAAELRHWVRRTDGPRLLVTGSYHHEDDHSENPGTRRRNTALAWVRGHDQPLTQDKHSPSEHPIDEDIQPQGWPQLRIYVTDDGWHIVIAIFRDLLNPQAVHTLTEAGANLILVPAMSETLMTFGGPAAHLVGSHQALVAVANNPASWANTTDSIARHPARALFGHPGFGQQTRFVHAPDPGPGVALLTVRSAQLTWSPAEQVQTPTGRGPRPGSTDSTPRRPSPPAWVTPLGNATRDAGLPDKWTKEDAVLNRAAVLVVLTDSPTGPSVLLTERADDLADYPGLLSFPGGRAEPQDPTAAATALREAAEEADLDPETVEVLGALPPIALPDSGFLVTPVLAWSAKPACTGAINLAEVTAVSDVPLRELSAALRHGPIRSDERITQTDAPDLRAIGPMTGAVIRLLAGILADADDEGAHRLEPLV